MSKRHTETLTRDELDRRGRLFAPDVCHSDFGTLTDGDGPLWVVKAEPFDRVVCEGRVVFTREFEGWRGEPVENPTVADVLRAMQQSIKDTGDLHHIFFEGYSIKGKLPSEPCPHCKRGGDEESVTEIAIHTGS